MRPGFLLSVVLAFFAAASPVLAADAFQLAERIIQEHHLLMPKARCCSKLILRNGSSHRVGKVGVYEVHNKDCGGDPDINYRLFDLENDIKTSVAEWDYNFPDMEMPPVPKRAH